MATRKTSPKVEPPWVLLSDDIPNVPDYCVWQNRQSGQLLTLADGVDPNDTATPAPQPQDESGEQTAAERVAEMLLKRTEGAEARVKVNEIQDDGSRAYCADYTPEEFEQGNTLELIRKQWGPGKYEIALYARNKNNFNRFTRNGFTTVVIKPKVTPDASESASSQIAQLGERLEHALAGRPPEKSPTDQLRETLQLMVMMREAMGLGTAGNSRQPTLAEQVGQLVQAMKGAQEIAREVNPQPASESLLERLAPKAMDIISQSMQQQARGLAPVALPPTLSEPAAGNGLAATATPSHVAVPQPAIAQGANVDADERAGFKVLISSLNGMALFQVDEESMAETIFQSIDPQFEPILKAPDWFDQLVKLEPSAARYRTWYTQVHKHLLKLFEEESRAVDEATTPTAPGGAAS